MPGLLFFLLIVWVLKNAAMDVSYAYRGLPNPRYEARKGERIQPGYGSKHWWADFKSDFFEERTRLRRLRKQRRLQLSDRHAPEDDAPGVGGRPAPEPIPDPELSPPPAAPAEPPVATPPPVDPTPDPSTEPPADAQDPQPPTSPDPPARPWKPLVITGGAAVDLPLLPDDPEPDQSSNGSAPKGTATMPVSAAEVLGLDQSIDYTKELLEHADTHGTTGNEGYIGELQSHKVTGAGISSAVYMQEKFSEAAAAAQAHLEELEKNRPVQEAFDQNPDAGDQEFQQAGR